MDKPEQIYSADRKGCKLCLNEEPKILGQKGAKKVLIVAHKHGGEYFSSFMWKCNGDCSTVVPQLTIIIGSMKTIVN
jgi:hypothetical protein